MLVGAIHACIYTHTYICTSCFFFCFSYSFSLRASVRHTKIHMFYSRFAYFLVSGVADTLEWLLCHTGIPVACEHRLAFVINTITIDILINKLGEKIISHSNTKYSKSYLAFLFHK